jgi:hypothetical protein
LSRGSDDSINFKGKGIFLKAGPTNTFHGFDHLPNLRLITEPATTADMIFISSQSLCGEDDFRRGREKRWVCIEKATGWFP